ncbi:hypothetical protein ACIBVL_25825 [Streptomyces sp. NPDC049687]|uniref:hypothetical protein n=1 Tax=Streptomyces sp. NPDC049687 TaxID=3365596 RepID=UPI0037B30990
MSNESLPKNAVFEKLAAGGVDVSEVMSLPGYVGSMTEGRPVQLFPSLQDLSIYVEIPADAILHMEKAAETTLPNNGVIVWVRNDTEVIFKRTRTVHTMARWVRHVFGSPDTHTESSAGAGAPLVTKPQLVETSRGRLRIMARDMMAADVCQSRCNTCQSRCLTCQSRPM